MCNFTHSHSQMVHGSKEAFVSLCTAHPWTWNKRCDMGHVYTNDLSTQNLAIGAGEWRDIGEDSWDDCCCNMHIESTSHCFECPSLRQYFRSVTTSTSYSRYIYYTNFKVSYNMGYCRIFEKWKTFGLAILAETGRLCVSYALQMKPGKMKILLGILVHTGQCTIHVSKRRRKWLNCGEQSNIARGPCPSHSGRCRRDFGDSHGASKTTNNGI